MALNLDKKPATAHLFIASPLSKKGISNLFSTHPPVEERVKRLREQEDMPVTFETVVSTDGHIGVS